MNLPNKTNKISNAIAIGLSGICLGSLYISPIIGELAFAPAASAQYGLGLSKSASSGGATRGDLPDILLLVPEDGAKTLASRPTFYWYIAPAISDSSDSKDMPKIDETQRNLAVTFILRDTEDSSAKKIFEAEGKAVQSGLYKFTLSENAPELLTGKVQRWQIRLKTKSSGVDSQINVSAPIRRDDAPEIVKAIAAAKNDLAKARIYAQNAYWYDGLDAYTSWLSQNPNDDVARTELDDLLKKGFKNHSAFMKKDKDGKPTDLLDSTKLSNFVTTLNGIKSPTSVALKPKISSY
jgi:hypothetical protein